jgi:phytanoyl-CoA hydroxylase
MERELDNSEIKARFDIDGFVNAGRMIEEDEVEQFSERMDAICAGDVAVPQDSLRFIPDWTPNNGVARRDAVWQVLNSHEHDDLVRDICEKPLIREIIELLLEGPARLWSTQVVMKPAYHGGVVPWLQDTSYWGQEKRLTCWLAIDNATPFNGCMRMIPGSHRSGQMAYSMKKFDGASVSLRETNAISEDTQVYVPVRPGCASFHHPLTLHASDANTTPHRRRAIAIIYEKCQA